jgi:hypothetical protein
MEARGSSTERAYLGVAAVVLALLVLIPLALAQGGRYEVRSWTVDGGGASSSGGSYQVSGTIGQPDAGAMAGGRYALSGGFWSGASLAAPGLYIPLVLRDSR